MPWIEMKRAKQSRPKISGAVTNRRRTSVARGEEVQVAGALDRVTPAGDVELAIDLLEVRLERVHGDEQLRGDLLIGQHRGQVAQHRGLALAERLAQAWRPCLPPAPRERALARREQLAGQRAVRGLGAHEA